MRVVVLGAGVIGVTTAWYLSQDGHEVTVIDREVGPGLETSFANGGQISASHAYPWAAPGAPLKILKWLGRSDAPLLFRFRLDPAQWIWGLRFLANCRRDRFLANAARNLRLSLMSRDLLRELRAETGLHYDEKTLGILHFFRTEKEMESGAAMAGHLREWGCRNRVLDAAECVALEPALAVRADELVGGIHTPDDESGDALKFTIGLAELCGARGVTFRFGETIAAIEAEGGRIAGVRTDRETHRADAYVLALGSYSPRLARPLGLRLPIYPTKGYSVTVPVAGGNGAPNVSLIDESHKIVYSRLGERLRIAGTAEFAGYDTRIDTGRAGSIRDLAQRQFPAAGDFAASTYWTGLRPMTPDGGPLLGRSRYDNLFLNTGHGTLGWTMCCGSGRFVADVVSGRTPPLTAADYALDRYG